MSSLHPRRPHSQTTVITCSGPSARIVSLTLRVRRLVQRDTRLVTFIHAVSALVLGGEFPGGEFGGGEHEPHVHGGPVGGCSMSSSSHRFVMSARPIPSPGRASPPAA